MKDPLGIALFNFVGLYRVLVDMVGQCKRLVEPPIITMHPDHLAAGRLPKIVAGAGFKVVPVGSERESDDRFIREQIDAADPTRVREIVLMSSDRDFMPEMLAKRSQGIHVYYVATMRTTADRSRCSVSKAVIEAIENGTIQFVELYSHRGSICQSRQCATARPEKECSPSTVGVTLRYSGRSMQDRIRLRNELARLERDFPGLRMEAL